MIEIKNKYLKNDRIYLIDDKEKNIVILNKEDEKPICWLRFDTIKVLANAINDFEKEKIDIETIKK